MFIVVNYSTDYGLCECERFATHEEAFKWIAEYIQEDHEFDFRSTYPFNDDSGPLRYSDNNTVVWAGENWCTCNRHTYSDYYIIMEA